MQIKGALTAIVNITFYFRPFMDRLEFQS